MNKSIVDRYSIRLKKFQREKILAIAKKHETTFARMVRIMVDEWIEQYEKNPISLLDEAKTKAISEMLYIVRRMADRIDPDIQGAARAHAIDVLAKIKEGYHEPSSH